MNTLEEITKSCPFPIGHENIEYEQYFAGKSYLYPLSSEQVSIANVTFEPDCRKLAYSSWWRSNSSLYRRKRILSRMGKRYCGTSCRRCRKYTSRSKALAWSNKK